MAQRDVLNRLEAWFRSCCDRDWENRYGVTIESTDNPGWWVKVDLSGTMLADRPFPCIDEGEEGVTPEWWSCYIEGMVYNGIGGVGSLSTVIEIFLDWAEAQA